VGRGTVSTQPIFSHLPLNVCMHSFIYFAKMGLESMASCMLDKHSTCELYPQLLYGIYIGYCQDCQELKKKLII
jgi:hypothetical protein